MAANPQPEILDLRHFPARQLRALIGAEAELWEARLRWDYRGSADLLLQYLDSRSLPGFVALEEGTVRGFAFCVYEGNKAVIGDAFSLPSRTDGGLAKTRLLLEHLLEVLRHSPGTTRIEAQLLLYPSGALEQTFLEFGFRVFRRHFMECDLRLDPPAGDGFEPGLILAPWSTSDYQAAAELIQQGYLDHVDAQINDQYRSLHGSMRFLHNIVRFPGCGIFDATHSWVLREAATGELAAIVLCSRISDGVAHVTQLCVAPRLRGAGFGRRLLLHCMRQLRAAHFEAISLTVTEENTRALRLYEGLGFIRKHRFDAMVYEGEPAA